MIQPLDERPKSDKSRWLSLDKDFRFGNEARGSTQWYQVALFAGLSSQTGYNTVLELGQGRRNEPSRASTVTNILASHDPVPKVGESGARLPRIVQLAERPGKSDYRYQSSCRSRWVAYSAFVA